MTLRATLIRQLYTQPLIMSTVPVNKFLNVIKGRLKHPKMYILLKVRIKEILNVQFEVCLLPSTMDQNP